MTQVSYPALLPLFYSLLRRNGLSENGSSSSAIKMICLSSFFPRMIYRCTSVPLHNSDPPLYFSNHGGSIFRSRKHRVASGGFREQGEASLGSASDGFRSTEERDAIPLLLAREIRRSRGRARMIHSCHRATAASRNSKVSRSASGGCSPGFRTLVRNELPKRDARRAPFFLSLPLFSVPSEALFALPAVSSCPWMSPGIRGNYEATDSSCLEEFRTTETTKTDREE